MPVKLTAGQRGALEAIAAGRRSPGTRGPTWNALIAAGFLEPLPGARHVITEAGRAALRDAEPTYRIVCMSLYPEDLVRADRMVRTLKRRGDRRVNRSDLVRRALRLLERELEDDS